MLITGSRCGKPLLEVFPAFLGHCASFCSVDQLLAAMYWWCTSLSVPLSIMRCVPTARQPYGRGIAHYKMVCRTMWKARKSKYTDGLFFLETGAVALPS